MHYPLIDRHLFPPLRLLHGSYNACVMLLFCYHAWLGLTIRSARRAKAPLPFPSIKRHRAMGPLLILFGVIGFSIGFTLVLLETGNIFEYPPHLLAGSMIVVLLVTTFVLSRKIKGPDSPYRTPHFVLGLTILTLYFVEVFLGIGVLI